MNKFLILGFILFLSGCFNLPIFSTTNRDDGPDRIQVFTDLLNQGWKPQSINNKIILIKETEDGEILMNDVFNIVE